MHAAKRIRRRKIKSVVRIAEALPEQGKALKSLADKFAEAQDAWENSTGLLAGKVSRGRRAPAGLTRDRETNRIWRGKHKR